MVWMLFQMEKAQVGSKVVDLATSMYAIIHWFLEIGPLLIYTSSILGCNQSTSFWCKPKRLVSFTHYNIPLARSDKTVAGAGGPGGACGICYKLTPVSSSGTVLSSQALTFMIIDECPAAAALSGGNNCNQCNPSEKNVLGQPYNFDIAIDAMSTSQVRLPKTTGLLRNLS